MLKTDETPTDYVTETAEAMALLLGEPCIHTIQHPYELPGGLHKMYQLRAQTDQAAKQEAEQFHCEGWLLESRVITAWYFFVPFQGEAG